MNRIFDLDHEDQPLEMVDLHDPIPEDNEVIIAVSACGVCHTELDEIEGRLPPPHYPIVPGHQVVGRVYSRGKNVSHFQIGDRMGVAWISSACGKCEWCVSGNENLCPEFKGTGHANNGGYAQFMAVNQSFAIPIPENIPDLAAAPLLCAGAIGYRSLRLANLSEGQSLGLTGFGASAHLLLKLVRFLHPKLPVYVFARSIPEQKFARELGATWAGDTEQPSPIKLQAIIDTTPVWMPVVAAMRNLLPGGRLVINAIRKESHDQSALLDIDYSRDIWQEKEIKSVANVTRRDVIEFLALAAQIPLIPEVQTYPLEKANVALLELKHRQIRGAKVLVI